MLTEMLITTWVQNSHRTITLAANNRITSPNSIYASAGEPQRLCLYRRHGTSSANWLIIQRLGQFITSIIFYHDAWVSTTGRRIFV
jgi:hypothetical protein